MICQYSMALINIYNIKIFIAKLDAVFDLVWRDGLFYKLRNKMDERW